MSLHIIVCVKAAIMKPPAGGMARSSESCDLNPFDRPALETARRLRQEQGGTLTALSMGPASCAFILHEAIAMGADRGILVSDPVLAGSDTLATSTTIAAAIQKLYPFDLVLFGTQSADSDTGHVGFRERFEVSFPAALTVHFRSAQPRDMSLFGIERAFEQGEVSHWNVTDLGLRPDQVGQKGSPTKVLRMSKAERGRTCEFLSGSAEEQAEELLRRLLDSGVIA
jgi:electron transfer flavoprotein beta subunit